MKNPHLIEILIRETPFLFQCPQILVVQLARIDSQKTVHHRVEYFSSQKFQFDDPHSL